MAEAGGKMAACGNVSKNANANLCTYAHEVVHMASFAVEGCPLKPGLVLWLLNN